MPKQSQPNKEEIASPGIGRRSRNDIENEMAVFGS
jgi:hypothetical protein